jgi:hypothetical protein
MCFNDLTLEVHATSPDRRSLVLDTSHSISTSEYARIGKRVLNLECIHKRALVALSFDAIPDGYGRRCGISVRETDAFCYFVRSNIGDERSPEKGGYGSSGECEMHLRYMDLRYMDLIL